MADGPSIAFTFNHTRPPIGMEMKHVYSILGGIALSAALWVFLFYLPGRAADEADVTVEGTVVSTEVQENMAGQNDSYAPVVTYRYQYDGQTYKSDNLEAGLGAKQYQNESTAESIVAQYAEGDRVTVHLDTDEPSGSFLRPPSHGLFEYVLVLFPLLFAGLVAYAGLTNS